MKKMDFGFRSQTSKEDVARTQLQAFVARTLAVVTVDPIYFSATEGASVKAAQEILKGLELLVKKDPAALPLCQDLRLRFPENTTELSRLELLRLISEWLHDQLDEFSARDAAYQLGLLKIVRVVIRWTILEDDLNGFMEIIIEGVLSPFATVQGTTTMCLSTYSTLQKLTLPRLFRHFEEAIGLRLARKFLHSSDVISIRVVASCIREFQFANVESFLGTMLPYILEPLICDGSDAAAEALRFLASIISRGVGDMLSNFFGLLLPVMVVRAVDDEALGKGLNFIERLTNRPRSRLLTLDCNLIHNELLLSLGNKPEAVVRGLKYIAHVQGVTEDVITEEDLADYLQPRFLGFVFFIDKKLTTPDLPIKQKRRVLLNFSKVVQFMGPKHISSVRIKLLGIFKFVLQTCSVELQPACFEAWNAFVRTLDKASLKSILSQIAVILLPFVKTHPAAVVPIFEYLIVENRRYLHDHFQELFFLPQVPALAKVNEVLARYTVRTDPTCFAQHLMEQLQFVDIMDTNNKVTHNMSLVTDDRRLRVPQMEVRQYALRKLKMLIRDHQPSLHNMIVAPNQAALRPISRLVATLMNCSREAIIGQERQRFGEVLGALGAIDPDWVEVQDSNDSAPARWVVYAGVREQDFAVNFLKELVRGYMTSEKAAIQDACGVVIQESLKFYELRDEKQAHPNLEKNAIWQLLSRDYQEVVTPFLTSKYVFIALPDLPAVDSPPSDLQTQAPVRDVLFGTSWCTTYPAWVQNWTVALIGRITVKTATAEFFRHCIHLIQDDLNRCVTLLPYVVLYLLVHCDAEEKNKIFSEMVYVLKSYEQPAEFCADLRQPATQTMLSLLDFLNEWFHHTGTPKQVRDEQLLISPLHAENQHCQQLINRVGCFVEEFTDDLLARASFNCKAYAKALMRYEMYLWQEDNTWSRWRNDKEALNFMQQVYVALEEIDGVAGLNNVRASEPSIEDKILLHVSTGDIQEALLCYEQLAQMSQNCLLPEQHSSIMRGLLDLDEPSKAMLYCNGVIAESPEWIDELNSFRIEAAWKLGQWEALDAFLRQDRDPLPSQWNVGVGRLLLNAQQQNSESFRSTMGNLQAQLMGPVCAASMDKGAYHRSYDNMVQLHTLHELEEGAATWFRIQPDEEFPCEPKPAKQLLHEWDLRLAAAQPSYQTVQRILTVRRVILQATEDESLQAQIGACWLKSAKIARKADHLQTAYSFLLKASAYDPQDLPREHAKYLWAKGESDKAIAYLERATQDQRWLVEARDKPIYPQTKLLLARYLDESKSLASMDMCEKFKEVVEIAPKMEKSHFYLGQYYDKLMEGSKKTSEPDGEQVALIVEQFVEALRFGCHFIHQTLPRLLTLWLDYGAWFIEKFPFKRGKHTAPDENQKLFARIQRLIKDVALRFVPIYVFLSAFPQLISRICIPNDEVFVVLAEVISKTVQAFPQQTMWHLAPVCQSKRQSRTRAYTRIMTLVRQGQTEPMLKFYTNMEQFSQQCVVFCNLKASSNSSAYRMGDYGELKTLRRLLRDHSWLHPVLPFRAFMTPVLPTQGYPFKHEPFSASLPTIAEFEDNFSLLPSLMRPKRVGTIDSAGITHSLLLKPKDDLRKDSRFMELVEMVNKFLREDSEARRRQLKIRTYSVVPLNEECGIIEWVPNLTTTRQIIMTTYRAQGREAMTRDQLNEFVGTKTKRLEEKMRLFDATLQRHPSVMHLWMERNFSDPTAWLAARLAYSRTCAVMCMVGYIMGLGDRHGENILLDTTTAEMFHVDFSCLFNKGESLEWVERVPFRLTHNVVDGMGPLGVEGFYRTACELTLKVIRHQKNAMMSVLRPFLHDPLVEWQQNKPARSSEAGESQNEEAVTHILKIERRISGQIAKEKETITMPLSVQGQVNYLIREATSKENLCQMYVGWAAFI